MGRVNIYIPDELAESARRAGLSVSKVAQAALQRELDRRRLGLWLLRLRDLPSGSVSDEVCGSVFLTVRYP